MIFCPFRVLDVACLFLCVRTCLLRMFSRMGYIYTSMKSLILRFAFVPEGVLVPVVHCAKLCACRHEDVRVVAEWER